MRNARGLSLMEVMLAIAIAAFVMLCAFLLLGRAQMSAAINSEQRQLDQITAHVQGQFAAAPSFGGLTTESITTLRPVGLRLSGGTLNSAFHGPIELSPATTLLPDDSYDVTYHGLSTAQCMQLVPALQMKASTVLVDGQPLLGTDGRLQEDTLLVACNGDEFGDEQGSVTFRFVDQRTSTLTPTAPPGCICAPQVEVQSIACLAGQVGRVDQRREGACTGGTPACPSLEWTAWTTQNNTCAPAPMAPPPPPVVSPPAVTCIPSTVSRLVPCTAPFSGQITEQMTSTCLGSTLIPGSWMAVSSACVAPTTPGSLCTPHTESMPAPCLDPNEGGQVNMQRSITCATAMGPEVVGGWIEVSRTCTASCLITGNCCTPQWFDRNESRGCSSGQYGTLVVAQQMATTCLDATATPAPGPWVDVSVVTDTCTSCPAGGSEQELHWVGATNACPSGYSGSHTWEDEEIRTRSITYDCPAGTSSVPTATAGTWSSWALTGARRNEVNTCAATSCSGSDTETQLVPTSDACPSGYSGVHTWDREQARTRTCNSGTWSAWSGWADTGNTTNVVNTCVDTGGTCTPPGNSSASIVRALANQNQDAGCPANHTGSHMQTRSVTESGTRTTSWTCPGPASTITDTWSGTFTYGSWTTTSNTCAATTPPTGCSTHTWGSTIMDANDPGLDPAGTTVSCGDVGTWEATCSAGDICYVESRPGSGGPGWKGIDYIEYTCTGTCAPSLPDGACPAGNLVMVCGVFNDGGQGSLTNLIPSSVESGDYLGPTYDHSQSAYCVLGYTHTIQANGFPDPVSNYSQYRFSGNLDYASTRTGLGNPFDETTVLHVYGRRSNGTNGDHCGTFRVMWNYE